MYLQVAHFCINHCSYTAFHHAFIQCQYAIPANKPIAIDNMITMLRILLRQIFRHAIIKIICSYLFYRFIAVTGFKRIALYIGYSDRIKPMINYNQSLANKIGCLGGGWKYGFKSKSFICLCCFATNF